MHHYRPLGAHYPKGIRGPTSETKNLNAHNLNGWWCKEGQYDVYNGVPLAHRIHLEFHRIYGSGDNTREQFVLFLTNKNISLEVLKQQSGHHEPSLTLEELEQSQKTKRQVLSDDLVALVKSRDHEIVKGEYISARKPITFRCKIHNVVEEKTPTNYKRAQTGMTCCGKAIQSKVCAESNRRRRKKWAPL